MFEEYDALVRNRTWELVPPNSKKNVVGCRWIFKIKRLPNGSIDRYKARLIAKGFNQRSCVDYYDTFSPVTARLVISIAISQGWSLCQLDVNNAFLQGHLVEDVFMAQPPDFIDRDNPSYVCKLHKAIYGIKQASRAWYYKLKQFLIASGFINSHVDTSLLILNTIGNLIYLLVYADNVVIKGNHGITSQKFITLLGQRFSIKDLGDLTYFLGVMVVTTPTGLILSQ